MSKPRGASDPLPPVNLESGGYCTFSLPTNLDTSVSLAEPFASISAPSLLSEDVTHSGWIRKEGFSVKTWKSRFMVLHHGCLYYFKATDSGSPRGKFALNGCRCETAPERENVDRFPYVFKVVPDDEKERTYYFSSPSKAEMEGWIEKIVNDISVYCRTSSVYDYADPGELGLPRFPTIAKTIPPLPYRRNHSRSLPTSPENALPPSFPTGSPYIGFSPQSRPRFPKHPPTLIPPKLDSDSDDSDDDSAPTEQIYLDIIANEDEKVICEQYNEQQRSQRTKTAPTPPPKPGKQPRAEEDEKGKEEADDFAYLPSGCYQPDLHKNQAKVLLELSRNIGGYIIHGSQSSDSKLVLSVWVSKGVKRYLIFKRNDMFTLYPSITDEQFPDLRSLIEYYYSHSLPKSSQLLTAPFSP